MCPGSALHHPHRWMGLGVGQGRELGCRAALCTNVYPICIPPGDRTSVGRAPHGHWSLGEPGFTLGGWIKAQRGLSLVAQGWEPCTPPELGMGGNLRAGEAEWSPRAAAAPRRAPRTSVSRDYPHAAYGCCRDRPPGDSAVIALPRRADLLSSDGSCPLQLVAGVPPAPTALVCPWAALPQGFGGPWEHQGRGTAR